MTVLCHLYLLTAVFVNMAFSDENKTLIIKFPKSTVDFIFFADELVFLSCFTSNSE